MPIKPGQGKTAVALFVDGLELKYVQLAAKGKSVQLVDFKTVALAEKFEEKQAAAATAEEDGSGFGDLGGGTETFGAIAAPEAAQGGGEANTNASVLLSVLGDLPSSRYTLSYALSEPAVTYHEFETDFGMKGTNLRKQIIKELSSVRSAPPLIDQVDMIPTAQGGLLAIIREDGLHIFDLLKEIQPFLGKRIPRLQIIDSADIALMNLVRASYEMQEEEVTVLVYVGNEFSRLIFLQGNNYLHFAPIISEGYNSPNLENTLYSRILLEQDNIALTRIDRILLAGDGHKVNLREALAPQFSSAAVEYVTSPEVDVSEFGEDGIGDKLSEYAIPIATAWRTLQPEHAGFYTVNLVPVTILEGQKAFKLAWHGWLVALGTIGSIVFFYTAILERATDIRLAQELLTRRRVELNDLNILRQQRDTLQLGISRFAGAAMVYDSIAPGGDRWSRILQYLAYSVDDLNSLWVYRIGQSNDPPGSIVISGRSIYRTRIPRLASLFEKATLRAVRTTTIRDKIVYDFDLLVEQVDKIEVVPRPFTSQGR
ncbi:MAG: hypothetical protein WD295_04975 [Bacteroidota bacterium]